MKKMIISKLYISEDIFCDFHEGLNIIIAYNHKTEGSEKSSTTDTNGVGKSIIINLIKKILAGDTETIFNSKYYEENKIIAHLEVYKGNEYRVYTSFFYGKLIDYKLVYEGNFQDFKKDVISYEINKVETPFDIQSRFADNKKVQLLSKKDFQKYINKFEGLDYSVSNITYSAILDFICRDEKNGFSDIISRIRRSQKVQYRSIQYLLNLPYAYEEKISEISQQISDCNELIKSKQKKLTDYGIKSLSTIENERIKNDRKLASLEKDKELLRAAKSIEVVRKEYKTVRQNLVSINNQITALESQISNLKINLANITAQKEELSEFLGIEEFYKDLIGTFPNDIKVNFDEYKKFIESISIDRTSYFEQNIKGLEPKLKKLRSEKSKLNKSVNTLSQKLNGVEIVEDISLLIEQEKDIQKDNEKLEEFEEDFQDIENLSEQFDSIEDEKKSAIKNVKKLESSNRKDRKKIIELFQDLVLSVYNNPECSLNFELNTNSSSSICGRTEIECSIPSDKSHGRTNAKICLFDFTWFLHESSLYNSDLLIHDGPYSKISSEVKHNMLNLIQSKIEGKQKQYVITINESELPYLEDYRKFFAKELRGDSPSGKFFKEQFDE